MLSRTAPDPPAAGSVHRSAPCAVALPDMSGPHPSCQLLTFCSRRVADLTGQVLLPVAGAKLLVFAHHTAVLDAIENACLKGPRGRWGVRIDGSTAPAARQAAVNEFQGDPQCRAALLSITAAGVCGLTSIPSVIADFSTPFDTHHNATCGVWGKGVGPASHGGHVRVHACTLGTK
jgi:hypothetical protein